MLQLGYETLSNMKTNLISKLKCLFSSAFSGRVVLLLAALIAATARPASAATTALRISSTGPNTEGLPTFRLDWDAESNSTYLVQSSISLDPGAVWNTLDAVQPSGAAGSYQLQLVVTDSTGRSSAPATFYRLVLPQPQISSVEPAVITPGAPVDLYVLGQELDTNDALQINGVAQSNVVFQSSTVAVLPSFTPDVAGTYQVSLLVSSVVVSSFSLTCVDAAVNPELVLQGPPEDPPASPSKKDFKGHVTLMKAFDDGAGDAEAKKDFKGHVTLLKAFDDGNDNSAARSHTKTGHVTLLKAFDDGIEAMKVVNKGVIAGGITVSQAGRIIVGSKNGPGFGGGAMNGVGRSGGQVNGGVIINSGGSLRAGYDGNNDPWGTLSMPALMKAKEKANQTKCVNKLCVPGVQPFSGAVQECDADLAIPGRGLDFLWTRTYQSRRTGESQNWIFGYDVHCAQNSAGGMDIYDGTGRKDTFTLQTNGTYACPQFFCEGSLSNTTFTLTFADTGRWVFNPFDGTATAGKLIQIITRNGDTMTLGYDNSGRLSSMVDDLGRTNSMSYNPAGQLASVTDFSGRTVTYAYYSGEAGGSPGDLKSVTSPPVTGTPNGNDFPDGKTVTYTYSTGYTNDNENHLLLSVTDAKGQPACQFTYSHDSSDPANYLHCITAQEGTNTPSVFNYKTLQIHKPDFAGTSACTVNDPVGNVSEMFFDARNRCVIEDDYTGRATPGLPVTDTVNRPTGKLRASDPDVYETHWSWNNDSLCTLEVSPGGRQMRNPFINPILTRLPPLASAPTAA